MAKTEQVETFHKLRQDLLSSKLLSLWLCLLIWSTSQQVTPKQSHDNTMIIRVSKLDGANSNALSHPTVQFAFYITACCMSTRCWPSELSKRATWCMMEHSLQKRNWYLWRVCPAFLRCLTPESSKEFWRSPTFPGHLMPLSWNKNDF